MHATEISGQLDNLNMGTTELLSYECHMYYNIGHGLILLIKCTEVQIEVSCIILGTAELCYG